VQDLGREIEDDHAKEEIKESKQDREEDNRENLDQEANPDRESSQDREEDNRENLDQEANQMIGEPEAEKKA